MGETLSFRTLTADEIDVRIGQVNKGGASLLLYKSARADQNILDDTVGPLGWQRHHSRDNANCIVSIRNSETGEWIEKEDTGVESNTEKEKGLASDSFKRACTNWGIGRELYTSPKMFIAKKDLRNYKEEGDKCKCYDTFKVEDISYNGKCIESVTIGVYEYGKKYASFTFRNESNTTAAKTAAVPAKEKPKAPIVQMTPKADQTPAAPSDSFSDDEVILIGNCKGKKYGEVKGTDVFTAFLRWVKNTNTSYPDPKQQEQYERFKALTA